MRVPLSPPKLPVLLQATGRQPDRLFELIQSGIGTQPAGSYLHWNELRHRPPPHGFDHDEWWLATKLARQQASRSLPLQDKASEPLTYCTPDVVLSLLHDIDRNAAGEIRIPELVTTAQNRDRYIVRSLMEEAITSSQLEGAATTLKVAKDMLQRHRKPRDRDEQMIANNYAVMQFIRDHYQEPLTPEIILELQRMLTIDTLDDVSAAGRWRRADETVTVADHRTGETLYIPPAADEIPMRMDRLCRFANDQSDQPFLHPVVRAILLHFMLGYDHPFVDGNGRTARAALLLVHGSAGLLAGRVRFNFERDQARRRQSTCVRTCIPRRMTGTRHISCCTSLKYYRMRFRNCAHISARRRQSSAARGISSSALRRCTSDSTIGSWRYSTTR